MKGTNVTGGMMEYKDRRRWGAPAPAKATLECTTERSVYAPTGRHVTVVTATLTDPSSGRVTTKYAATEDAHCAAIYIARLKDRLARDEDPLSGMDTIHPSLQKD